jgi:hypothetical protein
MFGCNAVQGALSHENKRNVIDGKNCVLSREVPNDEQKVDEFKFEENTVYTMEIAMSTGEGERRMIIILLRVIRCILWRSLCRREKVRRWLVDEFRFVYDADCDEHGRRWGD